MRWKHEGVGGDHHRPCWQSYLRPTLPAQRFGGDETGCSLHSMKSATRATLYGTVICGLLLRIVAGGSSAGGHIAVLASTTPDLDDPTDPPGIDTSVAAYML